MYLVWLPLQDRNVRAHHAPCHSMCAPVILPNVREKMINGEVDG